ncbi:MAG: hypothetical protein IJN92_08470 [Lachnospiraceae bacterium]|nr:hypothetical protein [Lachnospiraceae bacterium]
MKNKKILIFFIKCIVLLVLLFLLCFVEIMPQYLQNNQASLIDKVERLQSIEGSKIVLVGNSNLPFGIVSQDIEEALGMPVVNMGLHGGVGNVFNEQAAKINVHEGDIVVLCPSNFDDDDKIKNPELAWITIENHIELYGFIRMKDIPDMVKAYPSYLKKCINLWTNGVGNFTEEGIYARHMYNEYGDNISDRPESLPELEFSQVQVPAIGDTYVKRINELNEYLQERGATLVIAAYPIAYYEGAPAKEKYVDFQKELEDKMNCPVISDYTDYCLKPELFYNTYLHLTNDGAKIRTQLLIQDLKNYIEKKE